MNKSNLIVPDTEIFQPGIVKPEDDYIELQRLGKKLGIPPLMTFVNLISTDADGNTIQEYRDRSRTFNRNYWNWLFRLFGALETRLNGLTGHMSSDTTFGAGHLTLKTTGGTVTNANVFSLPPGAVADSAVSTTTNGIVVGTGTANESFEDVALGSLIATGNGAGQLAYSAMTFAQPSYNSGTKVWTATLTRILNNNSGGTIVVGETGLYAQDGNGGGFYMICRDKLGATVSVLNAGQLTVTYSLTLTFPA